MPNPFPGMDPYLEGPSRSTVHANLVDEIARQLAIKVRPKYLALSCERVFAATPDPADFAGVQHRIPDVRAVAVDHGELKTSTEAITASITVEALLPESITETYIEIRDAQSRSLVTAIEVLSPTNKRGDGLVEFRRKRLEFLTGNVHYLEIDLLRNGERFPTSRPLPSVSYFVFLSRVDQRPKVTAWLVSMNQPLPRVRVPLLPEDGEVELDLQQAWESIYELFGYDRFVDHSRVPAVPLSGEPSAWAYDCLQKASMVA